MAEKKIGKREMSAQMESAYKTFVINKNWAKAIGCANYLYNDNKKKNYGYLKGIRNRITRAENINEDEKRRLLERTYLISARDRFDDFMIAIEWDRPMEQRFWLPRREKLLPVCEALQDLEDGNLDELLLSMPPRVGKALANDTPILTRKGWKKHGDLTVGDEVIGLDGRFKKVIYVHPKCMLDRRVEMTNGEVIVCHANHEWMVHDRARTGEPDYIAETNVLEKRKLEYGGSPGKRGHRYVLQLPAHGYVFGEHKDLPLDPYTLGVWLGDGANKAPRICCAEKDNCVIERIVKNGNPVRWQAVHKVTGVLYFSFDIREKLQELGMCHSRRITPKRIPEEYITASIEQRLDLLAGLIDTDGTYSNEENRYQFTTAEETLRDSFIELISTFGWRASVKTVKPNTSSSGITSRKNHYVVSFTPDAIVPCEIARKRNTKVSKRRAISIKSITKTEPVEGNCITVEGDGMYLAGRTMLPTHNTTLVLFFTLWIMLRDPERSNLYCSYSDTVVSVFYNGLIEILGDNDTYKWKNVFGERRVVGTNAKDRLINIDRNKRYCSFTGRSLYGTLNGACDCNGYEIADDLISGIEEAMNKDRLMSAWSKVENNYLPRGKENAKHLWIGTRWSLVDPAGKRLDILENDEKFRKVKWKVVNVPALDKDGESNFDYAFNVGFSKETYEQRRASFERNNDMASWLAQYQGEPIERDGSVFDPDDLRYFNGELPLDTTPDRIFMAVDPAWGGGDFTAAPIICQFEDDLFVVDVVFTDGEKNVSQPILARKIKRWKVQAVNVEATKTTSGYTEGLNEKLKELGVHCNVNSSTSHYTGTGKQQRIFDKAPDIREHMIFLNAEKRSKEYSQFMNNVYAFSMTGKNKHDDAPDSLAMAINMVFWTNNKVSVMSRRDLGF